MKTSNKIVLALFSLPLIIMLFVYGSLYAKYKNKDFITEKQVEEERTVRTPLAAFHTINLTDYEGNYVVTITKGDAYAVSIDKSDKEAFSFDNSNGMLKIKASKEFRNRVTITCPDFQTLEADSSCGIYLNELHLKKLDCRLGHLSSINLAATIDSMNVAMKDGTGLELGQSAKIGMLTLQMLDDAKLEQNGGEIAAFGNVSIGDRCLIKVDGKTMQKLLQKTPQQ